MSAGWGRERPVRRSAKRVGGSDARGASVAACASREAAGPLPTLPPQAGEELRIHIVMAGLVPAIHVFDLTHT